MLFKNGEVIFVCGTSASYNTKLGARYALPMFFGGRTTLKSVAAWLSTGAMGRVPMVVPPH